MWSTFRDQCDISTNRIFIPGNETALLKHNNQSDFRTCLKKSSKLQENETFCNERMNREICDDRFSRTKLDFAENVQNGGNNSVEITRLARAETPHNFLVHWDLLRASLYGRQGWDSVLVPQQTLFEEHSNINHATVKAKLIVVKAVQGTCLKTNWCEVLL